MLVLNINNAVSINSSKYSNIDEGTISESGSSQVHVLFY